MTIPLIIQQTTKAQAICPYCGVGLPALDGVGQRQADPGQGGGRRAGPTWGASARGGDPARGDPHARPPDATPPRCFRTEQPLSIAY